MADFSAQNLTVSYTHDDGYLDPINVEDIANILFDSTEIGAGTPEEDEVYYFMRWKDVDAAGPTPTYRVWVATGAPDPTGAQYSGPKSGATPISDAVVADSWV